MPVDDDVILYGTGKLLTRKSELQQHTVHPNVVRAQSANFTSGASTVKSLDNTSSWGFPLESPKL